MTQQKQTLLDKTLEILTQHHKFSLSWDTTGKNKKTRLDSITETHEGLLYTIPHPTKNDIAYSAAIPKNLTPEQAALQITTFAQEYRIK